MLQEIRDLQNRAVTALFKRVDPTVVRNRNPLFHEKTLTFRAPTGSGKTRMMADFIDRVLAVDRDVVFLVSVNGEQDTINMRQLKEFFHGNSR